MTLLDDIPDTIKDWYKPEMAKLKKCDPRTASNAVNKVRDLEVSAGAELG